MWRSWLSRSPTPSRKGDERIRSATLPRPQRPDDDNEAQPRPSSSTLTRETSATRRKKGRFDFLRPKRWRTLSRSRKTSPKNSRPTSAGNAHPTKDVNDDGDFENAESGSTTPTNVHKPRDFPLCLPDSLSIATGLDEATPKAEEANKSMKSSLAAARSARESSPTPSQDSANRRRLSRKDLSKKNSTAGANSRQHTSKPSFFHFAKKTTDENQGPLVSKSPFYAPQFYIITDTQQARKRQLRRVKAFFVRIGLSGMRGMF